MTERFEYLNIPTWHSLTNQERWWLGYLGRVAGDNGWVEKWQYRYACTFTEVTTDPYDPPEQYRRFLCESLMTALWTPRKETALRALLQAAVYLGRLEAEHAGVSFNDAYAVARNRVETMLIHAPKEVLRKTAEDRDKARRMYCETESLANWTENAGDEQITRHAVASQAWGRAEADRLYPSVSES